MSVIKVENATSKKEMSLIQKMLYIKAESAASRQKMSLIKVENAASMFITQSKEK